MGRWFQFYHLNDLSYPAGSENALMTHALALGEANHNPGPLLEAMLAEMGWKYTYIIHSPVSDYDQLPSEVPVTAKVYGDYGIDTSSVVLHYSFDNWQTETVDTMLSTGNPDEYFASITIPAMGTTTDYYITVMDLRARNFSKPVHAPTNYYSFYVGEDTTPPSLSHVPVKIVFSSADSLYVEATATDNIGIASVKVELMLNNSNAGMFDLSLVSDSTYAATVPLPLGLTSNDVLEYRIIAIDSSTNSNQTTLPMQDYYTISVVSVKPAVTYYENNFDTTTDDFTGSDFTVTKTAFFDDNALHSPHPYDSPEETAPYFNYTTVLRIPIVLNANTEIAFDEVVLVEPGADNATFGSTDFYDYVVVEGSKDDGHTWKAIAPGWDSSSNSTWLTAYNKDMQNGNSLTEGSKDMFKRRVLNMTSSSDFSPSDTILVRFRLYSDPFTWAWGWCIDNLFIGDNVDVATVPLSPGDLRLYPNPVHDQMQLELDLEKTADSGNIIVYNYLGQRMYNRQVYPVDGRLTEQLDFSAYPPGMYLVNIEVGGQQISRKVIKR
ncbi:T9SS type A sorting domain-containing protein [Prolixibacter bellariivorans]|uniref:T9SS type A sorting domain-containing protein n=1 Tax=Prolixibacter bellariivorans TaxID=314319 RepID=UPI00046F8738|nr:T9SS type A sorting domain-containing protein [Prolixibacter bellariivorans]